MKKNRPMGDELARIQKHYAGIGNKAREILPNRLRIGRDSNRYTRDTVAELLGVSPQTVNSWERDSLSKNQRRLDVYTLATLAKMYSVSTDYLLGLDDEENRPYRESAKEIGISQMAYAKLVDTKHVPRFDGKNKALNALILNPLFGVFCGELTELYTSIELLNTRNELREEHTDDPQTSDLLSVVLSGGDYVQYRFESLCSLMRRMLKAMLNFDEAMRLDKEAIQSHMEKQLKEKKKEMTDA